MNSVNLSSEDHQCKHTESITQSFIFASCKPWHRPMFERVSSKVDSQWFYVSNPEEMSIAIKTFNPRFIFFLHWSWIVPEEIWSKFECVCFHMTDLPYGRGGSPLQNLILAGHEQTMLTALRMVREVDAGPVYAKCLMKLDGSAEEIYVRAGELSIQLIEWMIKDHPKPTQQEGEVVLFKRRKPEQSILPNEGGLTNMYDFIRMLDAEGYPSAFIKHGPYVIRFRKSRIEGDCVIAEAEIKLHDK